jgi:hypothetical protein
LVTDSSTAALHRSAEEWGRTLEARVSATLAELKVPHGLLPTCASCKRIRDDSG